MRTIWRKWRRRKMTTTTITPATVDDAEIMFRTAMLVREKDGAELSAALDRLKMRDPATGRTVIRLGTLGAVVSYGRAVDTLRTYSETSVIMYPQFL